MKRVILVVTTIAALIPSLTIAAVPTLVAHNAAHRVEQLMNQHKLDAHFQDRFYSIQVETLTPSKPTDPSFKATISEVPDAAGKAQQVEIFLDANAKALGFNEIRGPESLNPPAWPVDDAISLSQKGMHFLLNDGKDIAELKPFYSGYASQTLSPAKDVDGNLLARVQIKQKVGKATLDIFLKADGSFLSYKVTNP